MTQPAFPIYPVPPVPLPEMVTRSRREVSTRDMANARQFEHWQTDGKAPTYNRPDMNRRQPFHDFLPINARTVERSYRSQPRFDEKGHQLGMNSYFDKYDVSYDGRNAVRELQSVVYEDKIGEAIPESNRIITRNFEWRWVPEETSRQLVQDMRPSMDDFRINYRA